MKRLFTIDLKNYDENWGRSVRPSVRAIIDCGEKYALLHNRSIDPKTVRDGDADWIDRETRIMEDVLCQKYTNQQMN